MGHDHNLLTVRGWRPHLAEPGSDQAACGRHPDDGWDHVRAVHRLQVPDGTCERCLSIRENA